MPSLRSAALAVVAVFSAVAHADLVIEPSSVPISTRHAWCADERNTCPLICQQVEPRTTLMNDCDPKTLTFNCVCGNNQRPNVTEYTLTLPYFICQEWGNQCVKACSGDNECQGKCRQDHPCGAQSPKKYNTTSTTMPSATVDPNAIFTDGPGARIDSKGAGTTPQVGRTYAMALVLTGLFAGFALL
ncbi:hypothetical protein CDD80_2318 [Ophiocordyceps camponoti-rufipedis]|uniref:DUF7707 domain-containing protein n=1 Tax=Ophiocordyceps camponoti-rufipedis TaxID=2004952 RepID=A0A2C5Z8L9_9HYPO|nr:hypothetical protein CDD80_2318 [Ophiocordyceps camponoti-rufipedis]